LSPEGQRTLQEIAVPISLGLSYAETGQQLTPPRTRRYVSDRLDDLAEELRALTD
jgi:hypothetical protein